MISNPSNCNIETNELDAELQSDHNPYNELKLVETFHDKDGIL